MSGHEDTVTSAQGEKMVQTTLRLPAGLHRRLRVTIARDGRPMQEILEGMVEAWVRKKEAEHGE